jgi:periplasmic copper chaperone A
MLSGGAVLTAAVLGGWSSQASAHVTIDTLGPVTQASFAKIGFSVPNERDAAGTVKLSVQLPQDQPLAFVSVQPMPGWDIATTSRTLEEPLEGEGQSITEVVDKVTWTATGDTQIAPGEFELFWISAGQMPTDATELAFPAVQTYSSGEEVAWIDPTVEGDAEPERPAPTLHLVAADGGQDVAAAPTVEEDEDDGTDTLSIVALVVGVVALVAAGAALVVMGRQGRARPA